MKIVRCEITPERHYEILTVTNIAIDLKTTSYYKSHISFNDDGSKVLDESVFN